jgi:hypothetical protein
MDQDFINSMKPEMMPVFKATFLFAYFVYILIYSLYIRNLYKLLNLVKPANRRLQPSKVLLLAVSFLNIITAAPLFIGKSFAIQYGDVIKGIDIAIMMFMLIFTFYMVNKISESLDAELKSRNINNDPKPTLHIGMFMCICNTAVLLVGVAYLAFFGMIASVLGFVAWIMYWIKTKEYRMKLESTKPTNNLHDLGIF